MYTKPLFKFKPRLCYDEYGYCLSRTHPRHLRLVDIRLWHHGYPTLGRLYYIAVCHHRENPAAPVYVAVLGGSNYGARLRYDVIRPLMTSLLDALGIRFAMVALHFCRSWRLDFHVLAVNTDGDGRVLIRKLRWFRKRMRRVMRGLVISMNRERLARGQHSVAYVTDAGRAVFAEKDTAPAIAEKNPPHSSLEAVAPAVPVGPAPVTSAPLVAAAPEPAPAIVPVPALVVAPVGVEESIEPPPPPGQSSEESGSVPSPVEPDSLPSMMATVPVPLAATALEPGVVIAEVTVTADDALAPGAPVAATGPEAVTITAPVVAAGGEVDAPIACLAGPASLIRDGVPLPGIAVGPQEKQAAALPPAQPVTMAHPEWLPGSDQTEQARLKREKAKAEEAAALLRSDYVREYFWRLEMLAAMMMLINADSEEDPSQSREIDVPLDYYLAVYAGPASAEKVCRREIDLAEL